MKSLIFATVFFLSSVTASQQVFVFEHKNEADNWYITNDSVMGGISTSSVTSTHQYLVFKGNLRLENNGGFASTYRREMPLKLDPNSPIILRVKGDGRSYQLRLRIPNQYGYSYRAEFPTRANSLTEYRFVPSDFQAVWRGRKVIGAPKMDFSKVIQFGLLLADKRPGKFEISVQSFGQF